MNAEYELDNKGKNFKRYCGNGESFIVPKGVQTIGNGAFEGCESLSSVVMPKSVDWIGNGAFKGCSSLTSVELPDGLKCIGNDAFEGCSSLIEIKIPKRVVGIGIGAFYNCPSLRAIDVAENNSEFCSIGGALFSKDGEGLIQFPPGTNKETYLVPNGVKFIGPFAFWNCSRLRTIVIPESVESIRSGAPVLENDAFKGCSSLLEIEVAEKNVNYRSINGVLFSKDCETLLRVPIRFKKELYVVPDGVKRIDERAFRNCSLTSIVLPSGIESVGTAAFEDCSALTSVALPEGVEKIEDDAFKGCASLTSIVIPKGVKTIGKNAFEGCSSLNSFVAPEGLEKIEEGAFKGCSSLSSVSIPNDLEEIATSAFEGCSSLASFEVDENNERFRSIDGVLFTKAGDAVVLVPRGIKGAYAVPDGTKRARRRLRELFVVDLGLYS